MKLIFLGSGSAFTTDEGNFQSNLFLQTEEGNGLLIDCGTDARLSLFAHGIHVENVSDVYISHLHADHIGGLEWLALMTYFMIKPPRKPRLFIAQELIKPLWEHSLSAGLSTIQDFQASLSTFFDLHPITDQTFSWKEVSFKLIRCVHVISDHDILPCYGLYMLINGTRIFFTADTRFIPEEHMPYYKEADLIFHDCETYAQKSGVHAHYTELLKLPPEIKKKTWLYHYSPGEKPDAKAAGFLGFITKGQTFEF